MSDQIRPVDHLDDIDHANAAKELRISELYLAKKPVSEIMRTTGCTYYQYTQFMMTIAEKFRAQAMRNGIEAKGEELSQLDRLQAMYEDAWDRSKRPKTKTSKKVVPIRKKPVPNDQGIIEIGSGKTHEVAEVTEITEEYVGDEKFLKGILSCIDRRIKLWGLDEPDKMLIALEASGEGGSNVDIEARLAKYKEILTLPGGARRDPHADSGHNHSGESVDPNGASPEAGGVLDVSGRIR